jgi:hypothetical protein
LALATNATNASGSTRFALRVWKEAKRYNPDLPLTTHITLNFGESPRAWQAFRFGSKINEEGFARSSLLIDSKVLFIPSGISCM